MSKDDPFANPGGGAGDGDRTVIKPMPGGRGPNTARPSGAPQVPYAQAPMGAPVSVQGSGLNPLVNAATALLVLTGQLRGTTAHPDVAGLRDHVIKEVSAFEQQARSAGAGAEAVLAARYAICTLLDETVLSTPWGSESIWSTQSLLNTFHQEAWGGEKFFQILERLLQEPATNLAILELMSICLSLGFEGKYRVQEQGRRKLDDIQENLYRTIRMQRGEYERELSAHWQGVSDRRNPLVRYVPLWVVAALAGTLLLGSYAGFSYVLDNSEQPVKHALDAIANSEQPQAVTGEPQ